MLNDREIPVGQTNVPLSVLEREYGLKRVERSMKVWNFLLRSIADPTILRLMIESRSPQAAWRFLVNHYTERQEDERERLQTRWNDLKQSPDEDVLAYLARAETLRLGLSRYNVTWTEREPNRHSARHLNES